MATRRIHMRRSPGEWGARVALAVVAVILGYVGSVQSLAYGIVGSDAARAHVLAPWDGRITAAFAQTRVDPDAVSAVRGQTEKLARLALRQDPTAVAGASILAINIQLDGDDRGAQRLIAYAQKLSRRDLTSQIWSIENAVSRGDVASALKHYDIALRTTSSSADLLFPVLAKAIADPAIRRALTSTLATRPPWSSLFVEYTAANGEDPQATALLFRDLERSNQPTSEISRTLLIDKLTSRGMFDQAWGLYASFRRGAERTISRDSDFTANLASPNVFDWRAGSESGISVSLEQGVVDFSVSSSVGGVIIEQVELLSPGPYKLTGHSIGINGSRTPELYWRLQCNGGGELGRIAMPNSSVAAGQFSGQFTVPAGCPVQTLALIARPSDSAGSMTGQIDHIRLAPDR